MAVRGKAPHGAHAIDDQVVVRSREAEVMRLREGDGFTFQQIADRLGVNVTTIHDDYQRVSDRLLEESRLNFPRWRAEHLVRVAELHQKCLREFEASKRAKIRKRMQRVSPSKEGAEPTVTELQQMEEQDETGEPKFLEAATKAAALLANILGMTASENGNGVEVPLMPNAGLVSGPIIEISASVLKANPNVQAAIARFDKAERQRLLTTTTEQQKKQA